MMNKQIRRMIDEIFADMKMTADNLALRDELVDVLVDAAQSLFRLVGVGERDAFPAEREALQD